MYMWLAADIDNQIQQLKNKAQRIAADCSFERDQFTLPWHISLKITFVINDSIKDKVIMSLENFFNNVKPFNAFPKGIKKNGNIVWLVMKENNDLSIIHKELDDLLQKTFSVQPNRWDNAFVFHTTIFLDNNQRAVDYAYEQIKIDNLPNSFLVNKFIIGSSSSGEPGTFHIEEVIMAH